MQARRRGFGGDDDPQDDLARQGEVAAILAARPVGIADLPVDAVAPNPFQPRRHFADLDSLADAIRALGFVTRLRVRPAPGPPGQYELVYGERRLRAARLAGLRLVPVEIADYSDTEMLEVGLAENLQRADLLPLEEAQAFQLALARGYTVRSLAARIGKDPGYITDRLAALRAPADVRDMVAARPASLRAAREIAKLPNSEQRAPLIAGVVAGRLTTQDVRTLGPQIAAGTGGSPAPPAAPPQARPLQAPAAVVQVRLVAADEATLTRALAALAATPGAALAFTPTRAPGRKGDWIAYGTLRWEEE